jgi:TonB family protein
MFVYVRFLASVALGGLAILGATVRADAASCPQALTFASSDGKTYVAQFWNAKRFTGSADLMLYAGNTVYAASIPHFAISTLAAPGFQSKPFAVANSNAAALGGIAITYRNAGGSVACSQRFALAQPSPRVISASTYAEATSGGTPPIVPAVADTESPLPCAAPYVAVVIDGKAADAAYPQSAKSQGATGTAIVEVFIAADGTPTRTTVVASTGNLALDAATQSAAAATKYKPQIFRCKALAGSYFFKAEFTSATR